MLLAVSQALVDWRETPVLDADLRGGEWLPETRRRSEASRGGARHSVSWWVVEDVAGSKVADILVSHDRQS